MNGIIYCIINKINKKRYVGQTTVGLKKRYHAAWWRQKGCHNNYLKHSIEKYGIENFEWEILEQNVETYEELNCLEQWYAIRFNSYIPNGYNIRLCGENAKMSEETKQKISAANSKTHMIKDIYGEIYEISHLSNFCKERGLNRQAMLNLVNGWSNYSQGFLRVDAENKNVKMAKIYTFISPSDEVIRDTVSNISKRFQLKYWTLHSLVQGKLKTSKGWRLLDT